MTAVDPDEWAAGLKYRSGFALGAEARRRIVGHYPDHGESGRRLDSVRRELLEGLTDEDERDGVDDGLAGLRPRF